MYGRSCFFLWEESSGVWSNWNSTYTDPGAQKRAEGLLCGDRMSGVVLHWTLESQQDPDRRSACGAWRGI